MSGNLVAVDLSHWNPEPNWPKLVEVGILGVILKATEGTTYVDTTYHSRYASAKAAGLAVASYHFLKAGNIDKQMQHFIDTVQPVPGERLCIDHEEKATLNELVKAVKYLQDNSLAEITIYSGHLIKDQLGNQYNETLAQTSLWIAHYTGAEGPSWPKKTWPAWSLWQFTDKAAVTGISAPVDGNRFNGSAENCLKWFGPRGDNVPVPIPEPKPEPVNNLAIVSIQTPPGVDLQVIVNGKIVSPGS